MGTELWSYFCHLSGDSSLWGLSFLILHSERMDYTRITTSNPSCTLELPGKLFIFNLMNADFGAQCQAC